MTKKALADFLIGRGFDILAVLRLCRYPALKSFVINCKTNALPELVCDEYGGRISVEPANGSYSVRMSAEIRCLRIVMRQNLAKDESPSDAQIEGVFVDRRVAAEKFHSETSGTEESRVSRTYWHLAGRGCGLPESLGAESMPALG